MDIGLFIFIPAHLGFQALRQLFLGYKKLLLLISQVFSQQAAFDMQNWLNVGEEPFLEWSFSDEKGNLCSLWLKI